MNEQMNKHTGPVLPLGSAGGGRHGHRYGGWTQRTPGKVTRPQMKRARRPQIQQETNIKFRWWSLYVTFKSGQVPGACGGTGLRLTPEEGWLGPRPPREGRISGAGWLAGGQPHVGSRHPPPLVYFGCHWTRSGQVTPLHG